MTKPILSICIPTYNRAHYLTAALESIYTQLKDNPELASQVEISISDNASPDDTRSVAEAYHTKFPNYVYSRNEKNLGCDLNYLRVVQNASGEYIWFLGDDDTLLPGAIAYIAALVSTRLYDVGGVESIADTGSSTKALLPYTTDDVFTTNDPDVYFHKGYCRGVLSAIIVRRDKMLQHITENDFMEYWLYYEAALKVLGLGESNYFFVTKPMVSMGQDCRWVENGGELITFTNSNILHHKMIDWGFNTEKIQAEIGNNILNFPIILLRAKGHDLPYSLANLVLIWKNSAVLSAPRRAVTLLIFFIPNTIVKIIRDLRKKYQPYE